MALDNDDLPLDDELDTELEDQGGGDTPEPEEDDLPLDEDDAPLGDDLPVQDAPPTRGERRFQELNGRLRAAEEAAETARREAEELRRGSQQQDFRRQEEERLANMSESERVEYRVNQRLNHMQFQNWDTNDRVAFDGLAANNPAVSALKGDVEAMFQDRIRQGQPVDRTTIAKFLIGERALSRAPRARAAGKRTEAQGRERNQVRAPASRGGDNPTGNRRQSNERQSRADRLKDIEI